jgi:hypothetical protein
LVLFFIPFTDAQKPPSLSGRWEGTIEFQGQKLPTIFEIAQLTSGDWRGEYSVPSSPSAQRVPLLNVSSKDADVGFEMAGFPGYPVFKGKLAPDAKTISGNLSISGQAAPLNLERKADSSLSTTPRPAARKSEASKHASLEGTWEGVLDVAGTKLRLKAMLKASGQELKGTLDSLDQKVFLPIDTVTINGSTVEIDLELIQASFKGTLSQDANTITGTWEQGGQSFPLTLTKKI